MNHAIELPGLVGWIYSDPVELTSQGFWSRPVQQRRHSIAPRRDPQAQQHVGPVMRELNESLRAGQGAVGYCGAGTTQTSSVGGVARCSWQLFTVLLELAVNR